MRWVRLVINLGICADVKLAMRQQHVRILIHLHLPNGTTMLFVFSIIRLCIITGSTVKCLFFPLSPQPCESDEWR
jgi:hypothetical protein